MSDIFDEVDDILNDTEIENSGDEALDSAENNFNEAELHNIMAEIESLEKEFETDTFIEPKVIAQKPEKNQKQTDLQTEIDQELQMALEMKDTVKSIPISSEKIPTKTNSKVLTFEKKSSPEISFEAHGQMNLNLAFKIGDESATLSIDPVKGLTVTMAGVELCINEIDGCKVSMDSGVKFIIPLTSSEASLKKKSA